MIFLVALSVISCQQPGGTEITQTVQLERPSLQINNGLISWAESIYANQIAIYVNGQRNRLISGSQTSFNLAELNLLEGTHNIQIRFLAHPDSQRHTDSELSNNVPFNNTVSLEQLDPPSNVRLVDNTFSWDPVPNAAAFQVYANEVSVGNRLANDQTGVNINGLGLSAGPHELSVRAIGGGNFGDSDLSDSILVEIEGQALERLVTPNLTLNGTVLSWDDVQYAVNFRITLLGAPPRIYTVRYSPADLSAPPFNLGEGTHPFTVAALADIDSNEFKDSYPADGILTIDSVIVPEPLDAPNLSRSGLMLSWVHDQNTIGFQIFVNGEPRGEALGANITSFNIAYLNLGTGTHDITIRALAEPGSAFKNSPCSDIVTVNITGASPILRPLRNPSGLNISGSILSWNPVDYAFEYRVYLPDGEERIVSGTPPAAAFNLAEENLPGGLHQIQVRALAEPNNTERRIDSGRSSPITFTVVLPLGIPTNLNINNDGILTWNPAERATRYRIYAGGEATNTVVAQEPWQVDLNQMFQGQSGRRNISIRALPPADHPYLREGAERSEEIEFDNRIQLSQPQNLQINQDNMTVSWNKVTNATGYEVIVGGTTFTVTPEELQGGNLTTARFGIITYGAHTIHVRAIGNSQTHLNSDDATLTETLVIPPRMQALYDKFRSLNVTTKEPGESFPDRQEFNDIYGWDYKHGGHWVEARITQAIRDAEQRIIDDEFLTWLYGYFPTVLTGFQHNPDSLAGIALVMRDRARGLQNFDPVTIVPGFRSQERYVQDESFAPAETIGSGMIVHEHFRTNQSWYTKPDGTEFPSLPIQIIQRAIEFHEVAVRNMFDLGHWEVAGDKVLFGTLGTERDRSKHNVFDHFYNFAVSDRFINNTTTLASGNALSRDRAFGLQFNPNGFNPHDTDPETRRLLPEHSSRADVGTPSQGANYQPQLGRSR